MTMKIHRYFGRRRGQRMSWLDGVADLVDMNLSKLRELMKSRKAWRAAAPGVTESRTRHGNQTTSKPNQTGSKRQKWHQQPFPHQLMVQECAKPPHPQARFQLPSPSSRLPEGSPLADLHPIPEPHRQRTGRRVEDSGTEV